MITLIETPNYEAKRDRLGHFEVTHKATGKSMYLQGDDARQFGRDILHVPFAYVDLEIDQYCEVLS